MIESIPRYKWSELPPSVATTVPFYVKVTVVDGADELMSEHSGRVKIIAGSVKVCLAESFENERLGLWTPTILPGHYEHGFSSDICAPGSCGSLFLKGGNDSNFGMTLKLPTPIKTHGGDADDSPVMLPEDAESDDPAAFDGHFRPSSVSFFVRTDNARADAGHFILGESNDVNKRVAQFQFTKEGQMGLLGTAGVSHGATPYMPNRWYFIELRFDWKQKQVAFYVDGNLQQRYIPFRRETSSFIGSCALGNRDRCTTWFDSVKFNKEVTLFEVESVVQEGVAEAWIGPLPESAVQGFSLRVDDGSGRPSQVLGPVLPLSRLEGAQRAAINNAALRDFTDMLSDPSFSDVTFIVESREVHAHRCILTARCEAFRGMFNSAMREGDKACQQVTIRETSHAAFQGMLRFIYGAASMYVPEELAVELLGLADRYLLADLKLLCGFTLARMISVDTVVRIIQAADRWDSSGSQLKHSCMQFIMDNYDSVVSSSVFEELTSSPHLMLYITRSLMPLMSKTEFQPASCSRPPKRKRQP